MCVKTGVSAQAPTTGGADHHHLKREGAQNTTDRAVRNKVIQEV
jgi:hypothetical protein